MSNFLDRDGWARVADEVAGKLKALREKRPTIRKPEVAADMDKAIAMYEHDLEFLNQEAGR